MAIPCEWACAPVIQGTYETEMWAHNLFVPSFTRTFYCECWNSGIASIPLLPPVVVPRGCNIPTVISVIGNLRLVRRDIGSWPTSSDPSCNFAEIRGTSTKRQKFIYIVRSLEADKKRASDQVNCSALN